MTAKLTRLTQMKVMLQQKAVPLAILDPSSEYKNFQICLCSSVQVMCLLYLSEFNKK
jgi:hypothetical protein